jgi:hypothetical protein
VISKTLQSLDAWLARADEVLAEHAAYLESVTELDDFPTPGQPIDRSSIREGLIEVPRHNTPVRVTEPRPIRVQECLTSISAG